MLKGIRSSFFVFFFLLSAQSVTAGWIRTYGNHAYLNGFWVEQTTDAGYIITGFDFDTTHDILTSKPYGQSLFLVRTDSAGDTLWTRFYKEWPSSLSAGGRCVQMTADGGYVVAGKGSDSPWLLRLNPSGDTVWTRLYYFSSDMYDIYCVRITAGGYVMVGKKTNDLFIMTVDSAGDTLSVRSYWPGDEGAIGFSVQTTEDNGFIVTGSGPDNGLWILRTDSRGDTLWAKVFKLGNQSISDEGYSIEPTSDGNWIITGVVDYNGMMSQGALMLMKVDSYGDTLWTRIYDYGSRVEYGKSVKQTKDGGYIVVGEKNYSTQGAGSIWLLKTDSEGDMLWTRTYGGKPQDIGNCLLLTPDGGYIITGYSTTYSEDGSKKALLMKLDSLGLLGVNEGPLKYALSSLELITTLGKEITLKYSDYPEGFAASVFDATGRKVDEIQLSQTRGTIRWGQGREPGVYFIVADKGIKHVSKVVLVK